MADIDTLKAEVKKLNAKATQAKMDLHDLSEELPTNWERIPEVARVAHEAHSALVDARVRLAAAQATA
ncbi:CCE_0567 family metalloprotein [Azohydromonas aeria]|uniref:CCE_0567 family metalloprotein n=1 Tax=Azohydromonas aeria TaxID=2590212 RepID=UPI0012FCA415|nr:CCE_0567 family metalloprotein [Azohydromonas aeria]